MMMRFLMAPLRRLVPRAPLLLAATCLLPASMAFAQTPAAPESESALIARGSYLAQAGDCIACHTAKGGTPFAGGLPIATPLGTIYSTNITPSQQDGIGRYTEAQFAAALREGKRADGAQLYPAMPYTSYAKVSDEDVHALYTYFMKGVPAADHAAPPTALPFPFNIRLSMAAWNLLFLDGHRFQPDSAKSAEWNRGAYLVEGLAHCSTCHTPRNALMAENDKLALAGGTVGTWYAPNITSDAHSGIGGWSEAEIVSYLKTGVAAGKAQAAGPMAEAIEHSFQHMSDADLRAMAVYLQSVPAVHDAADTSAPYAWGAPTQQPDAVRLQPWPDDANKASGAQLYDANCASCHQANGQGSADGGLPSLFHNTALGHARTDNLVMAILQGVSHPSKEAATANGASAAAADRLITTAEAAEQDSKGLLPVDMPAFADKLSDTQVATLTNYLMANYGHPAEPVSAADVAVLRSGGAPSPLLSLAHWGLGIGIAIVLLVILLCVLIGVNRGRKRGTPKY
ncbi:cytochrome c [Robbsia sp. KACC 23696]|uniref:c-type cytochrome n=1 Tax=Robbsia sp. KACC 23696 TaxID=3149231 RepID=UPI00325B527D